MSVKIKDYSAKVGKDIQRVISGRLKASVALVRRDVVKSISTSTRASGPSAPGTPPHADTGRLRQSIFTDTDVQDMVGMVGTNVKYGVYLELGTSKMEPRPFLEPSLMRNEQAIKKILLKPIKK